MEIPAKLERDIARFERYLRESDAAWIGEAYGCAFPTFHHLRERISNLIYKEYKQESGLKYKSAESFAWKTGQALMLFVLQEMKKEFEKFPVTSGHAGYCTKPQGVDWHIGVDGGQLLQLGWDIMYYNQG